MCDSCTAPKYKLQLVFSQAWFPLAGILAFLLLIAAINCIAATARAL